ncbi:discoidin domain-containing protein [Methyloprofundus sp.]|uniref:discoidin domain-containing protein n=1 Tax=Methyloprofundus sp. TaxID=2020875 RepID=UPI003D09A8E9
MKIQNNTCLLLACLYYSTSVVIAEPATLSEELKLHVPVIQFQEQYLWADLGYVANATGEINFKLNDYGFLADTQVPPQLYDLDLVTDGPAPAIVDIKATEARLSFISSIPLACSVVYGKTLEFGAVAIDANMNGGAIIDHNPILINLEAETLYFYRVQGTDTQGRLYWDEVNSFTTAAQGLTDNNLLAPANGAIVTAVSSNFGGAQNNQAWGADSAIDGSANSAWSSAGDGDNAYIEFTLAEASQIDTLEVWSRFMPDGTAKILSFTISLDEGEVLGPFTLPDTNQAYEFQLDRTSSTIRLDVVTSTGGNTGLIEIAAYGK